ncbi:MAG: DNA polymerase III subunit gamma/tau [Phycisphaerae bacterium]
MAGYLVLARKYRSAGFGDVVGQEPIARTLVNAVKSGRVAHAYLFTGTRGVGKTTMARILAKALNCLSADEPTPQPCNTCEACTAIARGDDVDVVEIDGASNRGIEQIRELRANAVYRPARSRYKIYYIDEVHMLTTEAFNALLKTLEEPPEHVKFIFATTDPERVPATILSRCQRFDFRDIPTPLIRDHLKEICKAESVDVDDDALFRVARSAGGSMRDALSLLDQLISASEGPVTDADVVALLGTPPDERMLKLVGAIAAGDSAAALTELDGVLAGGVTLDSAATAMCDCFRNMMLCATCGPDSELIELPDALRTELASLAKKYSVPALVQAVGITQSVSRRLRGSSVARALVEAAVVRLAEAEKFVDADSLLQRLEELAGGSVSPGGGEKKKPAPPVAGKRPLKIGATGEENAPRLPCDGQWLSRNWPVVLQRIEEHGQTRIAGALRPAKVLSVKDGSITLGFDKPDEPHRRQCAGTLAGRIDSVFSELTGRRVRCEYVSTGQGDESSVGGNGRDLSTEDKRQIRSDPDVQKAIDLFGGDVVDMSIKSPPPSGAGDGDEAEQADEEA